MTTGRVNHGTQADEVLNAPDVHEWVKDIIRMGQYKDAVDFLNGISLVQKIAEQLVAVSLGREPEAIRPYRGTK